MKTVTVADLKYQIGMKGNRPLLYCAICGGEVSAHAGDYWDRPKNQVFECCGEPMALVIKRTYHEPA